MKAFLITAFILFSQFTFARYNFCRGIGQSTIVYSDQVAPFNCAGIPDDNGLEAFRTFNTNLGKFESSSVTFYSTNETDLFFSDLKEKNIATNKRIDFVFKNVLDIQDTLAKNIEIPASVIERVKNDLREELKAEIKAELLEELKNSK